MVCFFAWRGMLSLREDCRGSGVPGEKTGDAGGSAGCRVGVLGGGALSREVSNPSANVKRLANSRSFMSSGKPTRNMVVRISVSGIAAIARSRWRMGYKYADQNKDDRRENKDDLGTILAL
jgi:hypothetical protein